MPENYRDPNTGVLYPSKEWYDQNAAPKLNPPTGGDDAPIEPTPVAPTVGGDTNFEGVDDVNLQDPATQTPNLGDAKSQTASMTEYFNTFLENQKAERERLTTERAEGKNYFDRFKENFNIGDKREEEFADLGYDLGEYTAERKADIAEVESMMGEYDKMVANKDAKVASIEEQPVTLDLIQREKLSAEKALNIELSYKASQINSKVALMEIEKGDFDQATKLVNQAVEDYIYEKKVVVDEWEGFMEQNQELIENLDDNTAKIFQEMADLAQKEYEDAGKEQKEVGNLMLRYPNAGIQIGMTTEEAYSRIQAVGEAVGGEFSQTIGGFEVLFDRYGNRVSQHKAGGGDGAAFDLTKYQGVISQIMGAVDDLGAGGSLDVETMTDTINSFLEGYSPTEKSAIKNWIFEQLSGGGEGGGDTGVFGQKGIGAFGTPARQGTSQAPTPEQGMSSRLQDPIVRGLLEEDFGGGGTSQAPPIESKSGEAPTFWESFWGRKEDMPDWMKTATYGNNS